MTARQRLIRRGVGSGITGIALCIKIAGAQQLDSAGATTTHSPPCGACIAGLQVGLPAAPPMASQDTGRPHAIVYSSGYGTRLAIHRIASYAELPLFVAEYFVGNRVLDDEQANPAVRSSLKGTHSMIATGLEALFAVNTVTGVWNLIEARHDPSGRTRRWIHSLTMLAADAGFVATASSAGSARGGGTAPDRHRALAIGSMSLAAASTVMMWLWKD